MKKVFLFLAFAATVSISQAQVSYGVKAGANFSNFSGDDADGFDGKVGFNGGLFANIGISDMFSVQPEVVYSMEGAKSSYSDVTTKANLDYLNIPVLFQFHTDGFFAETGPQIGFLMSAKAKADGAKEDIKDSFKSTNFSWAVGLGYKLPMNLGINVRYNLGLSSIADGGESDVKVKSDVIQVGLFYSFGGK